MTYELWWTKEDAEYLRGEYQLAFGNDHRVTIKRVREVSHA